MASAACQCRECVRQDSRDDDWDSYPKFWLLEVTGHYRGHKLIFVVSPDDTPSEYGERISDYLGMGIEFIWIFDPREQKAWYVTNQGRWVRENAVLRCGDTQLNVEELFRQAAE